MGTGAWCEMRNKLFLCPLLLLVLLTACGGNMSPDGIESVENDLSGSYSAVQENEIMPEEYQVRITAGDLELIANMNDSVQARDFAAQLPLTVPVYEPADFAKAFDLQEALSDDSERTREYGIGTIAYWPEGPAVAIFFSDHAPQTVVPVIHIGQIDFGAENLLDYSGDIRIELLPENAADEAEPSSAEATRLLFSAGEVEITAELNDSPLARELAEALPADLTMTRLYEREYYGTPLDWEPDSTYETQVEYTPGLLAYWPRGNSLILFFGNSAEHPVMNSGIVVIGEILTDLSVFDKLDGTEEMTVSMQYND